MPESVRSCFELSIHLSVKLTSRELLLKIVRGKKNTGKCMESLKHNCTLSGTATSLQFFFLKILFLVPKFPIHEFFTSDVLRKLFDIGFPYKHCYFKPVCLLVEMASKTVMRHIGIGSSIIIQTWFISKSVIRTSSNQRL